MNSGIKFSASSNIPRPRGGPGAFVASTVAQQLGVFVFLALFWPKVFAAGVFDCVIAPRQIVEVRSPVEGLIDKVYVDRGDSVSKGQVLVEIDAGVERAGADLAKARAEMQGAIKSAEGRVVFSSRKFSRRDELQKQKFVSAQDRDEAEAEKLLAEAEMLQANDNKRIAQIEYRRAMEQLRLRSLKSPFKGVVMDRMMHPGAIAETGENRRPILKLADVDVLYVEVLLPVEFYRLVKIGMPVEVSPEKAIEGKTYTAKVTVVDSVLDAASGTFGVRLELPNPHRELPAGVKCKAGFGGLPTKASAPQTREAITSDGGPDRDRTSPRPSAR
jgi:RND family efflux transporter MFP subunit